MALLYCVDMAGEKRSSKKRVKKSEVERRNGENSNGASAQNEPFANLFSRPLADRQLYKETFGQDFPSDEDILSLYKKCGLEATYIEESLDPSVWLARFGSEGPIGAWATVRYKEIRFNTPEMLKIKTSQDIESRQFYEASPARLYDQEVGVLADAIQSGQQDENESTVAMKRLAYLLGDGKIESIHFDERFFPSNVAIVEDAPSSWATLYRTVLLVSQNETSPQVVSGLCDIANSIEQNPQMIHPKHLMDIAEEFVVDRTVPVRLRSGISGSLGYALRFFTKNNYEKEISLRLEFEKQESFNRTSRFLQIIPILYNIGGEYSYDVGDNIVISRMQEAVADAVAQNKGSCLLHTQAALLLEQIKAGEDYLENEPNRLPFQTKEGEYMWCLGGVLKRATKESSDAVRSALNAIDKVEALLVPPQHLVDDALARGDKWVQWSPDQMLIRERASAYHRLTKFFTEEVSAPFGDDNEAYWLLMSASVRKIIADKFGINIPLLSSEERGTFLHFVKTVTVADSEKVSKFTKRFGLQAARSFLATAYDPRASEYILHIGETFSQEDATAIFQKFAQFADAAELAEDAMVEIGGDEQRERVSELIQKNLLEKATGMLRRVAEQSEGKSDAEIAMLIGTELERYSVQGQMLVGTYRAVVKLAREAGKEPPAPNTLPGVSYEVITGQYLLSDGRKELETLLALYRRNFPAITGEMLAQKMREKLVQRPDATVHRVAVDNQLAAFLLVTPVDATTIHVSALNVSAELAQVGVGKFLVTEVLRAVREGKTVIAEAEAAANGSLKGSRAEQYIKQYGFTVDTEKGENGVSVDDDGATIFHLILRPSETAPVSTDAQIDSGAPGK